MEYLDKFVNEISAFVMERSDLTERELIRFVYLKLGFKMSFDEEFKPFGNSRYRHNVYRYHSQSRYYLNECMKRKKAICKSLAYILENSLKFFGVDIITIVDEDSLRGCPHVYNVIREKSGLSYVVDLQEDLYNIQSYYFTKNFGIDSIKSMNPLISRFEIEQIDRKLGYIDDKKPYADEYLYLLCLTVNQIDDFFERVQFILENINAYDVSSMGYIDIQWHHKSILEYFFDERDFDYQASSGKIRFVDCYKNVGDAKMYTQCIIVQDKGKIDIYVYNREKLRYFKVDIRNFARAVNNGLVLHKCKVPGLTRTLKNSLK